MRGKNTGGFIRSYVIRNVMSSYVLCHGLRVRVLLLFVLVWGACLCLFSGMLFLLLFVLAFCDVCGYCLWSLFVLLLVVVFCASCLL